MKKAAVKKPTHVLALRTCKADGTSYNGFAWPESGSVECADWKKTAECGNGLHGLLWGQGDLSLLSFDVKARWQVVKVPAGEFVKIDGGKKIKFPRCEVVFSKPDLAPGMALAFAYIEANRPAEQKPKNHASGTYGSASASGDYGRASASGTYGSASASGDYGRASASGTSGSASASGTSGSASASGAKSIAAQIGYSGHAMAGEDGCIIIAWWDGKRPRVCVGYVGEDGIEAGAWYRVRGGKLVKP